LINHIKNDRILIYGKEYIFLVEELSTAIGGDFSFNCLAFHTNQLCIFTGVIAEWIKTETSSKEK